MSESITLDFTEAAYALAGITCLILAGDKPTPVAVVELSERLTEYLLDPVVPNGDERGVGS